MSHFFHKKKLPNGLTILLLKDENTPLVIVNTLYKVGAINENPLKTGFAHLFEHYMFEGSVNISDYDEQLEKASGENNAYTTNDYTNYYAVLPKENIETALWLESDRMLSLSFDENGLATQKAVVCEEFKEHYINQPYGDAWHLLSALAYKTHPYSWPVIGKTLSHIENATMEDVRSFYQTYYTPQNAILCIAGNIDFEDILQKTIAWFGTIRKPETTIEKTLPEAPQHEKRTLTVERNVSADALYLAYKMAGRFSKEYYIVDLIRDLLSTGESSRLYVDLIKEQKLFSSISCYLTETIEDGLIVIEVKLLPDTSIEQAAEAVFFSIEKMISSLTENELQKVKNKIESYIAFTNTNLLNKVTNYCLFEMAGDATLYDKETENYLAVSLTEITATAKKIFQQKNCCQLNYLAINKTADE